jgi:hypothetical protein
MPNLPDPQVDPQGNDHYPSLDTQGPWRWPESVLVGCESVWARAHAVRDAFDNTQLQPKVSASSHAHALAIARCIRAHGFPTFPDPSASGGIPVGSVPPGFVKPNVSSQTQTVLALCYRRAGSR